VLLRRCGFLLLLTFIVTGQAAQWHVNASLRYQELALPPPGKTGFTLMSGTMTGIEFTNHISDEKGTENSIRLTGSGVALGDVDGDGWCDIYFCGLENANVLYRNLGNWKFEDITASVGVACPGQFSTGAVFADVDGDGDLDLLVNGIGKGTRLFVNDGKGRFREVTDLAGLRGQTGSMSMALADIDGNGTLDLYVANYRTNTFQDEPNIRFRISVTNNRPVITMVDDRPVTSPDLVNRFTIDPVTRSIRELGEPDLLYRNDGRGKFTVVSWTDGSFLDEDAKRLSEPPRDWGQAVMFRDMNGDGMPDLYVCNDSESIDRIWINTGSGKFKAMDRLALREICLY
jgi:hypothetical protein